MFCFQPQHPHSPVLTRYECFKPKVGSLWEQATLLGGDRFEGWVGKDRRSEAEYETQVASAELFASSLDGVAFGPPSVESGYIKKIYYRNSKCVWANINNKIECGRVAICHLIGNLCPHHSIWLQTPGISQYMFASKSPCRTYISCWGQWHWWWWW